MSKNCLILAPPLCGARVLAKHLVNVGYSAGPRCLPSRLDPSESSFEDEQTVYLNAKLFAEHKSVNSWNHAANDNAFSFFLDFKPQQVTWPNALAAPVLLAMQQKQPWVRKDPQFIFTCRYWKMNVWETSPNRPSGVFIARYPVDWIAAIMSRCDEGIWPHIPKDVDYLAGLWVDYMEHMMRILDTPSCAASAMVLTLDHLCLPEWQQKLSLHLGLSTQLMPDIQANHIRHSSRRDLQRADRNLAEIWNRWQWLVLRSGNGIEKPA